MAKIDTLRLLRARLSGGWPRLSLLLALFATDLLEMGVAVAIAVTSPTPVHTSRPYAAFDVPVPAAPPLAMGVAVAMVAAGLLWGAALVYEMVVLFRRSQIRRWRGARRLVPQQAS